MHNGTDFPAPLGTPIHAIQSGTVIVAGDSGGEPGIRVVILHDDGNTALYYHCSEVLVKFGQYVTVGQPIALVGSTGKATGNHLHLEIRLHAVTPVDAELMLVPWPDELYDLYYGDAA